MATRLLFLPLRKKAADEEWQEQDEEAEQTAADAAGVPPGEEHAAADAQADPVEARSSVPEDPGPSGSAGAPSGSGGDGGGGSTSATGSAPAADDEDPPGSRKRPRGATGSAGRWDPPDGGSKKRAAGLLPAEPGPAPAPPEAPAAPASSAGPASRHMAAAEHVRRLVEEHVNRRLEPYVADGRLSDLGRSVIAVKAAGKLVHHHASHVARGDASFLQSHACARARPLPQPSRPVSCSLRVVFFLLLRSSPRPLLSSVCDDDGNECVVQWPCSTLRGIGPCCCRAHAGAR